MNHVFPSLCLAFVIAASPALRAQTPATDTQAAIEAAVKRQSKLIEVRGQILQGRTLEAQKDIVAAAQQYNKALQGLREIGGVVEPEHTDAVAGLARTTLALADIAMRAGRFDDAKAHIDRVLVEDPKNKEALEMRVRNDRFIVESIGRTPHREAERVAMASETNRVEVQKLVMDGKLFYETGLLKEAEAALRKALTLDPDNRVAEYYLNLVNGRRYIAELRLREMNSKSMLMEVERQWRPDEVKREALPVPNPYIHTNNVNTSDRRQVIYRKLRNIRLTEMMYDGLPLSEVIKQISEEARRRDIETNASQKGINFLLSPNADSASAAPAAAGLPGVPNAPAVIPGAEGLPAPGPETIDLAGVVIKVGTPMRDLTLEEALNVIQMVAEKRIKWSVEDFGIVISPKAPETVPLHTRFFKVDPNTFWQGLANVTAFSFGESQNGGGGGGGRGGGGRGGRGGGGGGRGGRGGNFGGGNQFGGGGSGQDQGATYAGVSIAPGGTTGNQAGGNRANQGAQRQQGRAGQAGGGAQAGGGGALNTSGGLAFLTEVTPTAGIAPVVRDFFLASGITLDDPGKTVFFNDRTGVLMVRATLQDLDLIEKAVQMLNMQPPQMTIRAKFMEVNQDDNRALGFDWYLGNVTFGGKGDVGVQGGTAPSFQGVPTQNNPSGWFPGPGGAPGVPGPFAQPSSATDNLLTGSLRNSAPALGTLTGILTDPQFRVVVRAIEQRGGSDLLSAPEVTTQSGRQAQIKIVDIRYIVTDLDTDQTAAGVGTTAVGTVGGGGGGIGSLITPLAEPFELGPVLDVVPYVNADGYTITLTLLPTLKEFLGYDDPGQFVAQVQGSSTTGNNQQALTQPIPLPKFRLRQVATTANVWDGQTVVLGGLISENVQKQKDKVPMLGDIPFLGRFFRSESNISSKKNLVIFVTPRLIDPAGNPLHLDQDMPFAQHSVPTQAGLPQGSPRVAQ